MLRRFAAASLVASCVIPIGAIAIFLIRLATGERYYQMAALWCLVPAVWGVWAMLTPATWMPKRLPLWGAILGVLAGIGGALVVNLPQRIFQINLSIGLRVLAVPLAAVIYYLFWMVVAAVYRGLTPADAPAVTAAKAA